MTENELIYILNDKNFNSQKIDGYDAYIVKIDDMIGVAVPIKNDIVINEKFNKVFLQNKTFDINGILTNTIYLYTKDSEMSDKYASICLNFINPNSREIILNNPIEWYNEWSELLGDCKKNKKIYDFIGEMFVLLELQKMGKKPAWNAIKKGTFDITTYNEIYEVKSSIVKSFDSITIHNQFQLDAKGLNKTLYIAYVKLEENNAGESIDSLAKKLTEAGFDKNILEEYLLKNGYYNGKNERYKQFIIHEVRLYKVDETFPFITKDSFINKKIPNNVIKLEYTLSLDGLNYSTFEGENLC